MGSCGNRELCSKGWKGENIMMMTKQTLRLGVLSLLAAAGALAQTYTDLATFNGANGSNPQASAPLIQGTDGNLYGTTFGGGAYASGTIFQVTPAGTITDIYSFTYCSDPSCDGANPAGGLVLGADGNFYGVTENGGFNYAGTVFQLTPTGTLNTIYNFCAQWPCPDGYAPFATLIQATDGNFYGTTQYGGTGPSCYYGLACGTVFEITSTGTLTTLYNFSGSDGSLPYGSLIQASDGNFYGTTYLGGANNDGTIFQLTPAGTLNTLHSFAWTDGAKPVAGLIQASDGNFYGMTSEGGAHGLGTLFRITSTGSLTTLLSFRRAMGGYPIGALMQATDGNIYGTTAQGGANAYGTIFKFGKKGFSTIYSFGATDGFGNSGLFEATNGTFYGTANDDGNANAGVVFSLSEGLPAFVQTVPAYGTAGQAVQILGTDLTGATSVTFNGTAAAFSLVSGSLISATVPAGATSGLVTVTTPSGALKSNVKFQVSH